ncbi:MAG: phosphate/phosphite/phosphonate ABC transporter substrate-binding protein [Cyanobacteria bacterium P01_F01_bin.86]
MSKKYVLSATLICLASALFGCSTPNATDSTDIEGDAIILTDVDFDPDSLIPETQPVADYLATDRTLKQAGITQGEVQIAPDVETVAEWMAAGEVNLYFDSVYPAMLVMEQSGATPILRRWKDGVPEYNTYFVTRTDSPLKELADLQGNMIAMQSPSSSSGFMFPMIYMLEAGFNPIEKAEANHTVAEDAIGYVFSGEDDNTVEWILEGKVAAGALDNETWTDLSDEDRAQLTIIAETDAFPRHVVVAGPSLAPEQLDALKTAMVNMDESKDGKAALETFSETAQFDEFPEGVDAAIARLKASYEMLNDHLAQSN